MEDLQHLLGQRPEDRGRGWVRGQPGGDPPLEGGQEPAGEGVPRWDEVEDDLRMAGEPGRDGGVQVGHRVIRKEVDPPPPGNPGGHVGQELEPVGDPILRGGPGDHPDGRRQVDGIAGRHGKRPRGRPEHRGQGRPPRADRVPADDQGAVQGGAVPPNTSVRRAKPENGPRRRTVVPQWGVRPVA